MTITADIRQQVRQRAGCACEFCGVTEESAASELTIDHYQPQAKGGSNRRQRAERAKELMLLQRANEMVLLLENTNREMSLLMDEQRTLLKEQRDLLRLLLRRR